MTGEVTGLQPTLRPRTAGTASAAEANRPCRPVCPSSFSDTQACREREGARNERAGGGGGVRVMRRVAPRHNLSPRPTPWRARLRTSRASSRMRARPTAQKKCAVMWRVLTASLPAVERERSFSRYAMARASRSISRETCDVSTTCTMPAGTAARKRPAKAVHDCARPIWSGAHEGSALLRALGGGGAPALVGASPHLDSDVADREQGDDEEKVEDCAQHIELPVSAAELNQVESSHPATRGGVGVCVGLAVRRAVCAGAARASKSKCGSGRRWREGLQRRRRAPGDGGGAYPR